MKIHVARAVVGLVFSLLLTAGAQARAARVVLSDFTVGESSCRSAMAAASLSGAIQAELMKEPGLEWVERQQVEVALKELHLAAFGLVNPSAKMRLGKWLKADLLITGHLTPNGKEGGWTLRMEVVDLDHADVLATQSLSLPGKPGEPFAWGGVDLSRMTAALRTALKRASETWGEGGQQIRIAPLFFRNSSSRQRLDFFEEDLQAALQKAAGKRQDVKSLQFPRAAQAFNEAELAISGLSQVDLNAWQKVADLYVWGSFSEQGGSGVPFQEVVVDVNLTVWNGIEPPQQITRRGKVRDLPSLAQSLAEEVVSHVQKRVAPSQSPHLRKELTDSLVQRAWEIERTLDSEGVGLIGEDIKNRRKSYLNQLLATACFFSPDDQKARRARLRCWPLELNSPNVFWDSWILSKEWDKYVDQFGIEALANPSSEPSKDSVLQLYTGCIDRALQCCHGQWGHFGFPGDAPSEVAAAWQNELERSYVQMVSNRVKNEAKLHDQETAAIFVGSNQFYAALLAIHSPMQQVKLIETVWPAAFKQPWTYFFVGKRDFEKVQALILKAYEEVGQPQRARELLTYTLPEMPRKKTQDSPQFLEVPRLNLFPPMLTVPWDEFHFPGAEKPHTVTILCHYGGKLWISAEGGVAKSEFNDATLRTHLQSQYKNTGLYQHDPVRGETIDLSATFPKHSKITSMTPSGKDLWLCLMLDGVWCLNTDTLQVREFGQRDGLLTQEMFSSTQSGRRIFFGGGAEHRGQLNACDPENWVFQSEEILGWKKWSADQRTFEPNRVITLAGFGDWLLVDVNQPLLFNLKEKSWKNLLDPLFSHSLRRQWNAYDHMPEERRLSSAVADRTGIWMGNRAGMIVYNPDTQEVRHWFTPHGWYGMSGRGSWMTHIRAYVYKLARRLETPMPLVQFSTRLQGSVSALADDGDFLWIATATARDRFVGSAPGLEGDFIFLYHKPSNRWVGHFKIPAMAITLAVSSDRLWIGSKGNNPLISVPKGGLLSIPEEKWVADAIPEDEIQAQLNRLPPSRQIRYAFLMGQYSRVLELVKDQDIGKMEPDLLLLLGYSCDKWGLNDSEKARRYFQEILSRFGGTPWATDAREALEGVK